MLDSRHMSLFSVPSSTNINAMHQRLISEGGGAWESIFIILVEALFKREIISGILWIKALTLRHDRITVTCMELLGFLLMNCKGVFLRFFLNQARERQTLVCRWRIWDVTRTTVASRASRDRVGKWNETRDRFLRTRLGGKKISFRGKRGEGIIL